MLPEFKTILYPTDLSAHSPEIFRYAVSLAERYDAKIVIVHAVEPLSPFAKSMVDLYVTKEKSEELHREAVESMLAEIHRRLEKFCDQELCTDPGYSKRVAEIKVLEGRPAEVILQEIKRVKPGLVVMGSHGHTAVGEILLGTTAHRVTQRSPVPVLLVRLPKG